MTYTPADDERIAVAIDVGGTGIKCALVTSTGAVIHAERHPTGAERGPAAVVATITEIAAGLAAKAVAGRRTPVCAGVVIPGIVDEARGVAVWSANLGLRDAPLRDQVAARLGLPVALGHDVRAGALAEARIGAGRAARRMLFVAIGTGIASGYVIDGRVDPGAHGAPGEIGHIVVRRGASANLCGCGGRGCLEAHASASAIARRYGSAVLAGAPSSTESVNRVPLHARDVAQAVGAGDETARAVWDEAADALADGLLTAIALYDPELIVLGGGLAEAGELLLEPVRAALAQKATFHRIAPLVRAELGDEAGCQGAALLAHDLWGNT